MSDTNGASALEEQQTKEKEISNAEQAQPAVDVEQQPTALPFASFAVLDLETSNLPPGRVGITELSVYGVSIKELRRIAENDEIDRSSSSGSGSLPKRPRVLQKLTLLFYPRMMVHTAAEQLTGLSNYILEHDTAFDENAANTVLGFFKHLQQPVCLVAHNGKRFDFPILKGAFEKLQMSLPNDLLCVDTMEAFRMIDELRTTVVAEPIKDLPAETLVDSSTVTLDALSANAQIDWQSLNERTPKRPTAGNNSAMRHSKRKSPDLSETAVNTTPKRTKLSLSAFKTKRSLFTWPNGKSKYPPKGVYKQENMFARLFGKPPVNAHYAESDVDALLKIIQYYGEDFVSFATEHALPLTEIKSMGAGLTRN